MGDLAYTDIDVTVDMGHDCEKTVDGRMGDKWTRAKLTFGNGILTYPTGGIPLPAPNMFKMNSLGPYPWVHVRGACDGYQYEYDDTVRTHAPYGTIRKRALASGTEFSGAISATNLWVLLVG